MKAAFIPPIDHPDSRPEMVLIPDGTEIELVRVVSKPVPGSQLGGKVTAQAWRIVKSP